MEDALINVGEAFFGKYWTSGSGFNGINGGFAFPLLGIICYILGLVIAFQTLLKAARAAQSTGGNPHGSVWAGPIVGFFIAGILISIPQTVMDLNNSFFSAGKGYGRILAYDSIAVSSLAFTDKTDQVIQTLILFIQFIGWISIIRGFLMIKRTADGGNQSYAIGITHIIGGTLSANVLAFANAMQETICKTTTPCLFNFK